MECGMNIVFHLDVNEIRSVCQFEWICGLCLVSLINKLQMTAMKAMMVDSIKTVW